MVLKNMKKLIKKITLAACFSLSVTALAQENLELEEACFGDVDLTDFIVQAIESESANSDFVSETEAAEVNAILSKEANKALSVSEKVSAVFQACSRGEILQERYSYITGSQ